MTAVPATFAAARQALIDAVRSTPPVEAVPVGASAGRVLAHDLSSPSDLPPSDLAAMDGHAFDGALLSQAAATSLAVVGRALAGRPFERHVAAGECVRIMTGASLPSGTDTVLPLEQADAVGTVLMLPARALHAKQHVRRRGEELQAGAPLLPRARVLSAADIGLLAGLGLAELPCHRIVRVAVFSSGDELRAGAGQHDANRPMLLAALQRMGLHTIDLGIVGDDAAALVAALQGALGSVDAVIGTGGVSVGDADHTRGALATMGEPSFWQMPMRPGRPFAYCRLTHGRSQAWMFALPGNPAAAWLGFHVLLRPALRALMGARADEPVDCAMPVTAALAKRAGRTEFVRARVEHTADGWRVRPFADQGAASLLSVASANALIVLDHDRGAVAAGEVVPVWLLEGLAG